jgi:nicotinamidase-related amidase
MNESIFDKSALVIIDMQFPFLNCGYNKEKKKSLIQAQKNMIKLYKEENLPVITLEFNCYGSTIPEIRTEFEQLEKKALVVKGDDSGFSHEYFEQVLKEWEIKHLILTGVSARACVAETAQDAKTRGYQFSTAVDLISDSNDLPIRYAEWYKKEAHFYFPSYLNFLDLHRKLKEKKIVQPIDLR